MQWAEILWPLAFTTVALVFIWRAEATVRRFQENRRLELESAEREAAVARQERANQAAMAERTIEQRAVVEKARLTLEAAEAQVAAQVAEATAPDRITAERQAIAAYAEGHAEAERHRGLTEIMGHSDTEELRLAYQTYCENGGTYSFGQWMSGVSVVNGRLQS